MYRKALIALIFAVYCSASAYTIDAIIFSYDRPMQLCAYLESAKKYIQGAVATYVIYRASSPVFDDAYVTLKKAFPEVNFFKQVCNEHKNNFRELVLDLSFKRSVSGYIMYAVDDIIVTDFINVQECVRALEETNAYGFYLRLGKNITECYSEQKSKKRKKANIQPKFYETASNFLVWKFATGKYDWAYPHSVDMTIFRKADIKSHIELLSFSSPNQLESQWAPIADHGKVGVCYQRSKMVNIPMNIVQNDFSANKNMGSFSAKALCEMFVRGMRINIDPLYCIANNAPHMEYAIQFRS